jgi:probable deoxyuridine 5'-triphosphate nucleotidohydrolase yncF
MKIRINTHGNELPESYGEWTDLFTAEDVIMEPLDFKIISLGVSMELPKGYYANILPRSSTCKNHGIIMANSMAVIENSFCGDGDVWGFPAVAIRHTEIPKGTRICQFRLVKQTEPVGFEQVDSLGNPDRGGWGSTGTR